MAQELYELPQGWEWKELNSTAKIIGGGTPKTSNPDFWGNDVIWLSPTDLPKIGVISEISDSTKKITQLGLEKSSARLLPKGAVVFSTRATIGKLAIAGKELATNQGFTNFICNPSIIDKFLCHALVHFTKDIEALSNSTTFKEVSKTNLKSFQIPVPPLAEQERIVAKLDALFSRIDQAIAQLQHTQAQTKALFASALDAALLDPEEKHKTYTFDEICSIKSKLVDPRTTSNLEMLHVGGANIETLTGQLSSLQTAAQEKLISGKHYFDSNTVLYSKIRPYLRKVARPDFEGLCSADIYPLTPVPETLLRDYLFYILISEHFTQYAISGSNRAGMPKVNRNHLFSYTVNLPPLAEQSKIVAQLDAISERTQALTAATSAQLEKLQALKASLLDAAFRGQLPSDQ